jgi:predicted nucleic acid-binding protein
MAKTIVDAGPLIAFFRAADQHHPWAAETFKTMRPPFFSTEPAITEAAHFLTASGISARCLLDWVETGDLKIPFQLTEQGGAVAGLMDKYRGRMDLADATLVRLSELLGDCQILTIDYKDFSIYRRHGRQVVPLLTPPH